MNAPLTLSFTEIADSHRALVGGKAFSLAALTAGGFQVPEGFALTTAALEQFLVGTGVQTPEGELAEAELEAIRARLLSAPMPAAVREALLAAFRAHFKDGVALAVRSSGTKEDLEGASFAGQYETILNVTGEAALEAAVKRCWSSLFQARVLTYAARKAGGATGLSMCVAVQRMVPADVAGVLFTVHPLSGDQHHVMIESAFGLGEALVSGRVNADHFVVDARDGRIVKREIAYKELRIVPTADGTREERLDEAQLRALTEVGAAIQEHYGRPMDVEWALEGGRLYILQARPITRLSFQGDLGEWTTADFKDGGVSSDVCSPFMWSLYDLALEHSMPTYFKDIKLLAPDAQETWGRMFFARPYWNLGAVKKVLESIPGYHERNFDTDLGIEPTYEGPGKTTPTTLGGIVRALPVLFALKRSYRDVLAFDRAFVADFPAKIAPFDLDEAALAKLDRAQFVAQWSALITELYYQTESAYFTTIYNTSNSKLDFKVQFDKANKAAGGTLDYLNLVSGLRNLSHMRPIKELHDLCARLRREGKPLDDSLVRDFAQRWRHHGQKELDIRVPRWRDDLPLVRAMLEQALAAFDDQHDPERTAEAQHQAYLAEERKALAALGWRFWARGAFNKGLKLVRDYAWWREEMRDCSSFLYYLVRLWTVEGARRLSAEGKLAAEDDLWYLPYGDALELARGTLAVEAAAERIRAGRRMVRSFRAFQNPNEIGSRYKLDPKVYDQKDQLRGTACSPGRVEARARVIRRIEDTHLVQAGEILVTVFTDPGWTPLFARLAGVVTETGGVLAHAAVISREYGIPAVLAIPGATQMIHDGDTIAIDGSAGTVAIVKRA